MIHTIHYLHVGAIKFKITSFYISLKQYFYIKSALMLIINLLVIFFIFVLVVNDTLLEIMFQKVPIDNITFLKLKILK
jgi:hypothetical protein